MHQIRFRLGLRPRPLAGFKGPTSKGREGKGWEGEGTGEGRKGREGEREGREEGREWRGKGDLLQSLKGGIDAPG